MNERFLRKVGGAALVSVVPVAGTATGAIGGCIVAASSDAAADAIDKTSSGLPGRRGR